jgi:hypothetical protein
LSLVVASWILLYGSDQLWIIFINNILYMVVNLVYFN